MRVSLIGETVQDQWGRTTDHPHKGVVGRGGISRKRSSRRRPERFCRRSHAAAGSLPPQCTLHPHRWHVHTMSFFFRLYLPSLYPSHHLRATTLFFPFRPSAFSAAAAGFACSALSSCSWLSLALTRRIEQFTPGSRNEQHLAQNLLDTESANRILDAAAALCILVA
eukprot:2894585-Rhodomonas_salina.4